MADLFDELSRRLARKVSRRTALETAILGAAGIATTEACGKDSTGPTAHCTKAPYTAYCEKNKTCCDPNYPHYCPGKGCYKFFTDAQAACGNNYEICGNG